MTLSGKPIEADKTYRVAGWAPVVEGAAGAVDHQQASGLAGLRRCLSDRRPRQVVIEIRQLHDLAVYTP